MAAESVTSGEWKKPMNRCSKLKDQPQAGLRQALPQAQNQNWYNKGLRILWLKAHLLVNDTYCKMNPIKATLLQWKGYQVLLDKCELEWSRAHQSLSSHLNCNNQRKRIKHLESSTMHPSKRLKEFWNET